MGVHNTEVYPQIKKLLDIPEDEPIFILRGQDFYALETIGYYRAITNNEEVEEHFKKHMNDEANAFFLFRADNPGRIKVPDMPVTT